MRMLCRTHRQERGQRDGEGQLDGRKKAAVCARARACVYVHLRGEEESREQKQEEGQAKRRLPL